MLLRCDDVMYCALAKYVSGSARFLFRMPGSEIYVYSFTEGKNADVFCPCRCSDDIVGRSGICSIVGGPLDDGNKHDVCGEADDKFLRRNVDVRLYSESRFSDIDARKKLFDVRTGNGGGRVKGRSGTDAGPKWESCLYH